MARRNSTYGRPAHYLRRIWLDPKKIADRRRYPYNLPLFADDDFELRFETEITIIVGENGAGKSTLLGGIAKLAGYDEARGGKGYRPVDHSRALDVNGGALAGAFRASWLPKITQGWFFRAESFFSVARYLDVAAVDVGAVPPNFLSRSHGEGFLRFFAERCERQGIYLFDAPESALSPEREIEFLKLLRRMRDSRKCQVVMATHSPLLMAMPGATLLRLTEGEMREARLEEIEHFRILQKFYADPDEFMATRVEEDRMIRS